MPAALDEKEKAQIVDRLFDVFRDHGYEGASLADLPSLPQRKGTDGGGGPRKS
jgi:hypothetical protein